MRKYPFSHSLSALTLAALLSLAAPGAPLAQAATRRANAELLSSQLPEGGTLSSASLKDMKAAVRSAVAKRPADAADIVRIAIMSKSRKRQPLSCELVKEIVMAAMKSAPDQSRPILEVAQTLAPDCADEINFALRAASNASSGQGAVGAAVPGTTSSESTGGENSADGSTVSSADFGGGFGPGFPGSPTFGGSSPSGGFALPVNPLPTPTTPSTTSVVNN